MKIDVDILIAYLKKVLPICDSEMKFNLYIIKIPNKNIPNVDNIVSFFEKNSSEYNNYIMYNYMMRIIRDLNNFLEFKKNFK